MAAGTETNTTYGDSLSTLGDNLPYVKLPPGIRIKDFQMGTYHACVHVDVLPDSPLLLNQNASDPLANITNRLYCWGYGENGRLITADNEWRGDQPGEMGANLTAAKIPTKYNLERMYIGTRNTWIMLNDSKVYGYGYNAIDQLGLFNVDGSRQGYNATTVYDNALPANLGTNFTVAKFVLGRDGSCAVNPEGKMKCWGSEMFGG